MQGHLQEPDNTKVGRRMYTQKTIDDFLRQESFAVVGVSRSGRKFGNTVYESLKNNGRTVYPLNPTAKTVDGAPCYARLKDLPERVDGIVTIVPPDQTESIVKEAAELGIFRVWMQQGSESRKAIQFCEQYGIQAIHGRCILMFLEPVASVHKIHKWIVRRFHRLPA